MEQQRIIKIYESVAKEYADFKVYVLPSRARGKQTIILLQDTQPHSNFDSWCIDRVYRLRYKILDLTQSERGQYDCRLLFFDCNDGFVFYTVHPEYVFKNFSDEGLLERHGHEQDTRVICPRTDRSRLLQYLMFDCTYL